MINGKTVIAITLARGGSKGVPHKNRIKICGKPLIEYTIDEVKKSKYIDYYIVSTDDEKIMNIALKNDCFYVRRNKVADTQTSADGLLETLTNIQYSLIKSKIKNAIIVEIMATSPLKIVEDIDNTIEKLFDGSSAVSVTRVLHNHPSRLKYIECDDYGNPNLMDFFEEPKESRRQDLLPFAYVRNGAIYVMYYEDLKYNNQRLNGKIVPYIMPEERSINIDGPLDLILAKHLIKNK